jgi:hypothetical protein
MCESWGTLLWRDDPVSMTMIRQLLFICYCWSNWSVGVTHTCASNYFLQKIPLPNREYAYDLRGMGIYDVLKVCNFSIIFTRKEQLMYQHVRFCKKKCKYEIGKHSVIDWNQHKLPWVTAMLSRSIVRK